MLKLSKNLIFPLIAVLLIGTVVGSYFFFENFQMPKYFVDRYPELIEYCDTEESENGLKVSCEALMLNMKPNVHNETPSLTSLIITNNKELKEYTLSEKSGVFVWTNDLLQYKRLKPIIINIQYTKGNLFKYSLNSITFENIPDTYIQEIVNSDIEEIMGIDKSSPTILNSFDFCPRPETLPDYVIKKDEYATYWGENILSEAEYLNRDNYGSDDIKIKLFFACDSAQNLRYNNLCTPDVVKEKINLKLPQKLNVEKIPDSTDYMLLELMSQIYNSNNIIKLNIPTDPAGIINILSPYLNVPVTSDVFCMITKVFDLGEEGKISFNNILDSNFSKTNLIFCEEVSNDAVNDKTGLFIKGIMSRTSTNLSLFSKCKNLSNYIYNK